MGMKVDQGGCRVGLYIQPASKGIYAIVAQKKLIHLILDQSVKNTHV